MNQKIQSEKYRSLYQTISDLYHQEENKSKLLFHGWHHIKFVHDKTIEFAAELSADLEREGKAVADADTLFKALPTTPILFASKFITQNKYDISKLAHKVVDEQEPLMKKDEYFYTKLAKDKYINWANTNIQMWKHVLEALEDESIREMLHTAKDLGVL